MKRRILSLLLAFVLVFMIASIGVAAQPKSVGSGCEVYTSYFHGNTSSIRAEPNISISVTLKRLVGNNWEYYDSSYASDQNSKQVTTSKPCVLEGGYYYKAFVTHYTTSRGSWTSESNMLWVP